MGKTIPIRATIFFLVSLQWLVGPALTYLGLSNHYKYHMYVNESEYFPFVISGIAALTLGLFIFENKKQYLLNDYVERTKKLISENPNIPAYLIIIGAVSMIFSRLPIPALKFVFFLLENFLYIGGIYYLFSENKRKYLYFTFCIVYSLILSINSAMFHSLLLWLLFFSFYYVYLKSYNLTKKLLIVFAGFFFMFLIQSIKSELRLYVWSNAADNKMAVFFNLAGERIFDETDEMFYESNTSQMIIRINQGWIISRIMSYIPDVEDFVKGETVKDAINATLVPRFINPNKTTVGGQIYFERFTGMKLLRTSMGASLIGEGYANYGKRGAVIFLFIIGLLISYFLNNIYKIGQRYPSIVLWLPLLFLQVIKAESDLIRILNHLVKSGILVFLFYLIFYRFLRIRV